MEEEEKKSDRKTRITETHAHATAYTCTSLLVAKRTQVSVRRGGHNLDHAALRDGVLLVDVTGLNKVGVDKETEKARGTQHTYAHAAHKHTHVDGDLSL